MQFFYQIGFIVYDTNRLLLSIKLQFLLRGINLSVKKQYTYQFLFWKHLDGPQSSNKEMQKKISRVYTHFNEAEFRE